MQIGRANCQEVFMRNSTHPSRALTAESALATERSLTHALRTWRVLFGIALLSVLASCNNGYDNNFYNSGVMPAEISLGVVTGNFNANGYASVVAMSAIKPAPAVGYDNLKVYPSTRAGAFAGPVFTADGVEPLYLASADLNGDGLPDVVSASASDDPLSVFF